MPHPRNKIDNGPEGVNPPPTQETGGHQPPQPPPQEAGGQQPPQPPLQEAYGQQPPQLPLKEADGQQPPQQPLNAPPKRQNRRHTRAGWRVQQKKKTQYLAALQDAVAEIMSRQFVQRRSWYRRGGRGGSRGRGGNAGQGAA